MIEPVLLIAVLNPHTHWWGINVFFRCVSVMSSSNVIVACYAWLRYATSTSQNMYTSGKPCKRIELGVWLFTALLGEVSGSITDVVGIFNKKRSLPGTRRDSGTELQSQNSVPNILTYSIAQQPLKSFDRPLMRVSLSNSILVTLVSTGGRVMGDKSIASWAN